MNRRRLFILSFFIVCIVIIAVGLLYWYSEQRAEQKLQFYITKLEKRFTVKEDSLSDFDVDNSVKEGLYNDFTLEADCEGIGHIYFDRKIHALYFLEADGDRVEAHIFNYKWASLW